MKIGHQGTLQLLTVEIQYIFVSALQYKAIHFLSPTLLFFYFLIFYILRRLILCLSTVKKKQNWTVSY